MYIGLEVSEMDAFFWFVWFWLWLWGVNLLFFGWLVGWFLFSVGEIWMVLYSNHKSSFVVGPEITYPLSLSTPGWVG